MVRPRAVAVTALAAMIMITSGCGPANSEGEDGNVADARYPMTVQNCGAEITIDRLPERVVLLTGTDAGFLAELGVLDRVVGKAGAYRTEYHDDEVNAALSQIPDLQSSLDESASLEISNEVILDAEPDLVLDAVQTARADVLPDLGVPVLNDEAMCPDGLTDPGFDDVYTQLETYGRIFDREEAAEAAIASLQDRVEAVTATIPEDESRTAAVLYPIIGGSPRAYGNRSMAGAIIETAGFTNVYADMDERRAEINIEDLLGRNPDLLILLHVDGEPSDVENALTTLPGADRLTAVQNGDLMTMLFNFAGSSHLRV